MTGSRRFGIDIVQLSVCLGEGPFLVMEPCVNLVWPRVLMGSI